LRTALPGDSSKVITNVLNNAMIPRPDCGTDNGLEYSVDDSHILDRYEAGSNELVTDQVVRALHKKGTKTIKLRSPMTCLDHPGVCQKCWGHNNQGQMQYDRRQRRHAFGADAIRTTYADGPLVEARWPDGALRRS